MRPILYRAELLRSGHYIEIYQKLYRTRRELLEILRPVPRVPQLPTDKIKLPGVGLEPLPLDMENLNDRAILEAPGFPAIGYKAALFAKNVGVNPTGAWHG